MDYYFGSSICKVDDIVTKLGDHFYDELSWLKWLCLLKILRHKARLFETLCMAAQTWTWQICSQIPVQFALVIQSASTGLVSLV